MRKKSYWLRVRVRSNSDCKNKNHRITITYKIKYTIKKLSNKKFKEKNKLLNEVKG